MKAILAGCLMALLANPEAAEACSCVTYTFSSVDDRTAVPAGATQLFVRPQSDGAQLDGARLFRGDAIGVPLLNPTADDWGVIRYDLGEPLRAGENYRLEYAGANGGSVSHFMAVAEPHQAQPATITALRAAALIQNFVDSCHGERRNGFEADLVLHPNVAMLRVSVAVDGVPGKPRLLPPASLLRGGGFCSTLDFDAPAHSEVCVTVTSIDFTGTELAPQTLCTAVRDCGSADDSTSANAVPLLDCKPVASSSGCGTAPVSSTNHAWAIVFVLGVLASRGRRRPAR